MSVKRIGVLTSGGDAPGMNPCVRAVVRTALYRGLECYGIRRGWNGLITGDIVRLDEKSVSHTINRGGTILYTARSQEFMTEEGQRRAVSTCKFLGLDSIIAIGGGSSMDVARGINIVRVNGGSIIEYTDPAKPIAPCNGMIAVPTTAGTGSEMSNALVVTEGSTGRKLAVLADPAVSEYAVLNADLMLTLPAKMTIACGLDAFCHAAEGYLSRMASPVTDAICEKAMFLLYNYLPRAVANGQDREARERVMVASTLAGWMLNNAGTIAGHSIAHVLGAKYHIVHGEAVGYALPAVMEFVAPVRAHKVREIGQILGAVYPENAPDEQVAIIASRAFKDFRDRMLGLHPVEDYGISVEELVSNAQAVVDERFAGNTPRDIDLQAVEQLLEGFGSR